MSTKFFVMIICYLWTIEIQAAQHASSSDLPTVLPAALSGSQNFDKSECVSQSSEAEPIENFSRGSLLECESFCKKNQEQIELCFYQLSLKKLDIEIALMKIESKISELDEVKQKMDKTLLEADQLKQEFAAYVENVEARILAVGSKVLVLEHNIQILHSDLVRVFQKIDEINSTKVSPETLTLNGHFMSDIEKILARLLLEKYAKPPVQTSSNDDDSLPSGRASTSSYSPKALNLLSSDELDS